MQKADGAPSSLVAARGGRLLVALQERAIQWGLDGYVLHAHAHLAMLPAEERRAVQPALHLFVQVSVGVAV